MVLEPITGAGKWNSLANQPRVSCPLRVESEANSAAPKPQRSCFQERVKGKRGGHRGDCCYCFSYCPEFPLPRQPSTTPTIMLLPKGQFNQ